MKIVTSVVSVIATSALMYVAWSLLKNKIYKIYIMWQFLLGFGAGVYVGTKYDCRPCMKYVEKHVTEYFPKKDEEEEKKKIIIIKKFKYNYL